MRKQIALRINEEKQSIILPYQYTKYTGFIWNTSFLTSFLWRAKNIVWEVSNR